MKTHATAGEMSEHGHENHGCCCLVGCNLGPCSDSDDPCTDNPNPHTEVPAPLPTEAGDVERERPTRKHDGLRTYERIDADGERYYDGIAAEADLKALHAEVSQVLSDDICEIVGIDPTNPMDILASVLQSDWLAQHTAAALAARETETGLRERVEAVLAKSFDLMPQQSLTPTAKIEVVTVDDLRAALDQGQGHELGGLTEAEREALEVGTSLFGWSDNETALRHLSPVVTSIIAARVQQAGARALREALDALVAPGMVAHISNWIPLGFSSRDPYPNVIEAARAILTEVSKRLNHRADRIGAGTGGDHAQLPAPLTNPDLFSDHEIARMRDALDGAE